MVVICYSKMPESVVNTVMCRHVTLSLARRAVGIRIWEC